MTNTQTIEATLPVRSLAVAIALLPLLSADVFASDLQVLWVMAAIALLATAALSVPTVPAWLGARPPVAAISTAFVLASALTLSLAVHRPIAQLGVQVTAAAVAGCLVAAGAAALPRRQFRGAVASVALWTAAAQGALMAIQQVTESPLVLSWVSDRGSLTVIDGLLRTRGTMRHPFEPALIATAALAMAFVAVHDDEETPRWWALPAALATLAVGLSYSRAGLLGCVAALVIVAAASRRRRGARVLASGMIVGLAATALIAGGGWIDKVGGSLDTDLDEASQGRWTLIDQALPVIADHPLLGVGPGRYQDVLEAGYRHDPERPFNAHNLVVHAAAELGVPAAVALLALLTMTAVQALRAGAAAVAAFALMLPWLLFDILYYDTMVGQVALALWLAALAHAEIARRHTSLATRSS